MKTTFTIAHIGIPDSTGDIIMPGSIKQFANIVLTREFDCDNIIGRIERVAEVGNELKATAEIPADCMSLFPAIGFRIIKAEKNEHGGHTIHEMALSMIGLSKNPNVDQLIKPLNQQ